MIPWRPTQRLQKSMRGFINEMMLLILFKNDFRIQSIGGPRLRLKKEKLHTIIMI
jgi:hypothetical protein